jgi:hypothetical protein
MTCTLCNHPQRVEMDREIVQGIAARAIARRYGASKDATRRHRQCISDSLERAGMASAFTAKSVILDLVRELRTLATDCLNAKMSRDFLLVADRLTRATEVFGKLTGEISSGQVNALFVNLGVRNEGEIRSALDLARAGREVSLDDCEQDGVALLLMVLAERPERRISILTALAGGVGSEGPNGDESPQAGEPGGKARVLGGGP